MFFSGIGYYNGFIYLDIVKLKVDRFWKGVKSGLGGILGFFIWFSVRFLEKGNAMLR